MSAPVTKPLKIMYVNHRGVLAGRVIRPQRVYYGTCLPWHPEPTWLLDAYDEGKAAFRTFDLARMQGLDFDTLSR